MPKQAHRRRLAELENRRGARPFLALFQDMQDPDLYHTEPRSWPPYLDFGDQLYHEADLEALAERHTLIVSSYVQDWPGEHE